MKNSGLFIVLFLFLTAQAWPQQGIASELRSLQRDTTSWSAGQPEARISPTELPDGEPSQTVLPAYAGNLRNAIEAAERSRSGDARNYYLNLRFRF